MPLTWDLNTPVYSVKIGCHSSGANTLVAATSGKIIRILAYQLIPASDVSVYFTDSSTGKNIIGDSTDKLALAQGGGEMVGPNPWGWGDATVSEALVLNLSSAVSVGGSLTYTLI